MQRLNFSYRLLFNPPPACCHICVHLTIIIGCIREVVMEACKDANAMKAALKAQTGLTSIKISGKIIKGGGVIYLFPLYGCPEPIAAGWAALSHSQGDD